MPPRNPSEDSLGSSTPLVVAQATDEATKPASVTSVSCQGPRLPQELLDLIVSFVDDVDTLVSCWLSSRILFQEGVKLMLRIRRDNYVDVLHKLGKHPEKASAVRILSFSAFELKDKECTRKFKDIAKLISHLKNLEHIDIRRHNFKKLDVGVVPLRGAIVSPHITRLTFIHTEFEYLHHLLCFIDALPGLQDLTLDNVAWQYYTRPPNWDSGEPLIGTSHLRTLRIRRTDNDSKHGARLLSEDCVRNLETVVITAASPTCSEGWWKLWSPHAEYPHLRHLTIRNYAHQGKNGPPPLPNTHNLQSLTLGDILTQYRNNRVLDHGMYIKHFLDSVNSTRVQELVFKFDWDPVMDMNALAVADWLPSLCHEKFANLVRVTYSLRVDAYYQPLDDIREAFTARIMSTHEGWSKRNILNIDVYRGLSPPL